MQRRGKLTGCSLALVVVSAGAAYKALAATLPVPCAAGACGSSGTFVSAGQGSASQSGSKLTVTQATPSATFNWQSFDISADGSVQFVQPSASAVALNRIFQASPSQIFGALSANGRVFLINGNGIIFGPHAQVSVGSLVASTLNLSPLAADGALLAPSLASSPGPALVAFTDANGNSTSQPITVQAGASITASEGGQILMFAPQIANAGTLSSPGGQTILAAGQSVYLAASNDPNLRGLLVEVGTGGTVTNGTSANAGVTSPAALVGQIIADRGNVTLAGLAVNQEGRVSATTTVNANGSIYLQARDQASISTIAAVPTPVATHGGKLVVGANSVTEVSLAVSDPGTAVDSVAQPKSDIELSGATVTVQSGSLVSARGGRIGVFAAENQNSQIPLGIAPDGSRIDIEPGAVLDVSGAQVELPVSSNVIAVQLRGTELADSPLQQAGPLRGQTVYVDVRATGTNPDGSTWVGTPLANVTGEIGAIPRNVAERNLTGGTISLVSQGDVIVAHGATLDLAGGSISYTPGFLNTSTLVASNGRLVGIASADPNLTYLGIAGPDTVTNAHWGTTTSYPASGAPQGVPAQGYVEGKDAGSLTLITPRFILDGNVDGSVVRGPYQRSPDTALPDGSLYRPVSQVPLGATLVIGTPDLAANHVVGSIEIAPVEVLGTLSNPNGAPFDPATSPLPASYTASVLRPGLLGADGFSQATIYANGSIVQRADAPIVLPQGGALSLTAAIVALNASIDAPSGTIAARAVGTADPSITIGSLTLGSGAQLSARGAWVNDSASVYPLGNTAATYINGGQVSLTSQFGDLTLAPGSSIDVSGGAWLTSSGSLNAGTGGAITIAGIATPGVFAAPSPAVSLGASFAGYGLRHGGTLSITAGGICVASADCTGGDARFVWISPRMITGGGFGNVALGSGPLGISVAPGTVVGLQQQNLILDASAGAAGNAASLGGITTVGLLPDYLRAPMNLSLSEALAANAYLQSGAGLLVTPDTPSLVIGAGAIVQGDPGASLSLTSDSRVIVDGTLRAPGGSIALRIGSRLVQGAPEPTQAIWLGSDGVLDVAGVAQIVTDPNTGLRSGQVRAGGSVTITANRGSIELLPGSLIDLSGASGVVDVTPASGAARVEAERVGSAGGSLALTAAEGIVIGGSLVAGAGQSGAGQAQPAGGVLSVRLDAGNRVEDVVGNGPSLFSSMPRVVVVSDTIAPVVVGPGLAVPGVLTGDALVPASVLESAGFGSVTLQALPFQFAGAAVLGQVAFAGDSHLSVGRQITLDAASLAVSPGATVSLSAPYVEIGNSDTRGFGAPPAVGGTGSLQVAGSFIELYGTMALEGVGQAAFASTGDLRLRGVQALGDSGDPTAIAGALASGGSLALTAQQIYPATLTQFSIAADPTRGTITIGGAPGIAADLLSAGGSLTLSGSAIEQAGTLRAPFGSISLQAPTITLAAGSVTSTSANGLSIPFGTTQGGFDWVYPLQGFQSIVYGSDGAPPPSQRVSLQGAQVTVAPGAVVDVSGGGDLLAYEWINGVGGTHDVLSPAARPGQYAIVPGLNLGVAPYDPNLSANSALGLGDSIHLAASPGLPAGDYVLLPARYALFVPGAFLVSPVNGYQDLASAGSAGYAGGGTIVSGYRTVAGTALGDSRTSGFAVVPASVVLQQAQYTTTSANTFFAAQSAAASLPTPRRPQDAGIVSIAAGSDLTLAGTLRTKPADGGAGAVVGIASEQILITPDAGAPVAGTLVLDASSLNALGAQTLLIGGDLSGRTVTAAAQTVTIAPGVSLAAPRLLLAAANQISVADSATLTSSGATAAGGSYVLDDAGAFLGLSTGALPVVTLGANPVANGTLLLSAGSSVRTGPGGSAYLLGLGGVTSSGQLDVVGGDLGIQSTRISLGAAPAGTAGTVLDAAQLGADQLRSLVLTSGSTLDLYGSFSLSLQQLAVSSAGLRGFGSAADAAVFNVAGQLTLNNASGAAAGAAGTGTGALRIGATDIGLADANTLSGFGSVSLAASHALTAVGSGSLVAGSAVTVTTPEVRTAAGASFALVSSGAVRIVAPSGGAATVPAGGLGGELAISGASVEIGTRIDVPSGRLTLSTADSATAGAVMIDSGATLNAAGVLRTFDLTTVASPGGTVALVSSGDVAIAAGSTIDVSGPAGGQGGTLSVAAPGGTASVLGVLKGNGAGGGGSFSVDAQAFGDFAALNGLLNAGGFGGSRAFRLRGAGDILVAAGSANTVTARSVALEADNGAIVVEGVIDASGPGGGSVSLAAAGDVQLAGRIDAHATGAAASGGTVDLETVAGRLLLESGSTIDVSGGAALGAGPAGAGGTVLLRAPRATVADAPAGGGVVVASNIVGASRTTLEGYATYSRTVLNAGDVTAAAGNPLYDDAATFMALAPGITAALGRATDATFSIVPGIEIDSPGKLTLATAWDLSPWRFNGVPGVLTLRAAGGVDIAASLSDGFAGVNSYSLPGTPSSSWSYRIVAGADSAAASVLAVDARAPADVVIEPGVVGNGRSAGTPVAVRTGDGFIDVAASGRFVLGNQASVLYTAGVSQPGITNFAGVNPLRGLSYPTGGGDIRIDVGGDIVGAPSNQFVTGWLWRVGGLVSVPTSAAAGWTVNFQYFQQGIAALGGGDVSVRAGGNILDLNVSIPEIGRQVGGTTIATSVVDPSRGGNLTVSAGGSIFGGGYFIGAGQGSVTAGRDIAALAPALGGTGLAPLLGLGDAPLSVQAAHDLTAGAIVNPTLLPAAIAQRGTGYYSTYGSASAVSLTSIGGQVTMPDQSSEYQAQLTSMAFSSLTQNVWSILPSTLQIAALSGDVSLARGFMLMPSPTGSLAVLAQDSIMARNPVAAVQIVMADADPSTLPSPFLPGAGPATNLTAFDPLINAVSINYPTEHGPTPVHAGGGAAAAEFVAATGDVSFEAVTGGFNSGIWTATPARIVAGRDILNLDLTAQNLVAGDVTLVSAGRDISYPLVRASNGQLVAVTSSIAVDGPGVLDLLAGRNINLGVSNGVTTRGNLVNPALGAGGASVTLSSGLATGKADYPAFIQTYILGADTYDEQLTAFVASVTGSSGLSVGDAKARFPSLPSDLQRTFADQVFIAVLQASGRQAASAGSGDFSAAFAAIDVLFPGANPDLAAGQANPYQGDIALYFSRVYTLAGGSISLLAPGGGINVGLANPPASFNVNKTPSELGIVAQSAGNVDAFLYGDFQVNQSRVFAADGGNILVWSTEGNIDAGRGAKTSISAPPPTITFDANGQPAVSFPAALFGSGIQTLATSPGVSPGDVDLFAPHGVVNANDAGIVAGNLTVAATAVLGSGNITVSGTSVGVPVVVTGLGASVAGATSSGGAASTLADAGAASGRAEASSAPAADAALGWLEVFVTGLGEEGCRPDDLDCLKRQPHK